MAEGRFDRFQRGLTYTSVTFAAGTLLLGLVVLFGWHTGNRTLVQVLPQFVPMQYNTALGFVCSGAALLGLMLGRRRLGDAAGALAVVIGSLTLMEYIGQVDFGIDELFMKHEVTVKTSNPGRMAPNTALCFVLVGLAVAYSPSRWPERSRSLLRVILASLAFGLSTVALSGYLAQLETAYGWGNLTRMALHTSVGFILVSIGTILYVWTRDLQEESRLPEWMPVPLGIGFMTAAISFWQALAAESDRISQQYAGLTTLSLLAIVMLVVGILLAVAITLVAWLAQKAGARARDVDRANALLEVHRDNLEKTVAERTQQLEQAREDAESANRSKSAFLANMSHELRTPLNAIIGYSEMIVEDMEDEGQDEHIPDLNKINASGKHLLALINDILDLSKIEAGRTDLYLENFEVETLLGEAVATATPLVEKNGNRLITEFGEGLGGMRADVTKVRQALFNLLSNAAKFTKNGTVTFTARREMREGTEWLVFAIADSGIGIAPEKLGLVFEEFSQADDHTTRNYGGTGLGLAISLRFCRMMGGDVHVKSEVGVGSSFEIELPANVEMADETPAPSASSAVPDAGNPSRADHPILVIDDNEDSRDVLKRTLEDDGHAVATASGGEEGLRLARELHPSLIILDVMMPGMDGWSVLRQLKADPVLHPIPVVIATVIDNEIRTGFSLGASEYLTKPVDRERLIAVSRDLMGSGSRALVVEDDPAARQLILRSLESAGFQVEEATNGQEGLACIAANKPDLVLLDLMMPVMHGFEFMERLREDPETRELPVVVLTAKELSASERDFLRSRTDHVLEKGAPGTERLLPLVRRTVADHRARGGEN